VCFGSFWCVFMGWAMCGGPYSYLWAEGISLQEFESQLVCPTLQTKLVLLLCLFISGYGQTFWPSQTYILQWLTCQSRRSQTSHNRARRHWPLSSGLHWPCPLHQHILILRVRLAWHHSFGGPPWWTKIGFQNLTWWGIDHSDIWQYWSSFHLEQKAWDIPCTILQLGVLASSICEMCHDCRSTIGWERHNLSKVRILWW